MTILKKEYLCTLYDVLTRPKLEDFGDLGGTFFVHPDDPTKKCLYIQTHPDSKVLAVGHTDYVMFTHEPKISINNEWIRAPQLDDRLGLWVLLSLYASNCPKDMPYDILLTDLEEKGQTTAALFNPPVDKQYNWMFEWDRRGTDMVMYDYETPELKTLLESYDFKVGNGSFTDIGVLDYLGCAGLNFGTAYYGEHTKDCKANLKELILQLSKFRRFYTEQYNNHLVGNQEEAKKHRARKTAWMYGMKKGNAQSEKLLPFSKNQNAKHVVGT